MYYLKVRTTCDTLLNNMKLSNITELTTQLQIYKHFRSLLLRQQRKECCSLKSFLWNVRRLLKRLIKHFTEYSALFYDGKKTVYEDVEWLFIKCLLTLCY